MSYLFKDFLSLEDVGEYINQYGYSYNLEIEEDYYRLKDAILDLHNEQKLSIVFHYNDFATIETLKIAENGSIEQIEEFEFYISGYFHVPEAPSVLKDEANLRIIQNYYSYYLLHDKDELPIYDNDNKYKNIIGSRFTSIEFGDDMAPSIVELSDLRFPKADLDKLFNEKSSELKSVKDELSDVQAQNAKLVADIEENKTTGSSSMGTSTVAHGKPKTNEQLIEALTTANNQIADLKSQLVQAKAELADKLVDDKKLAPNSEAKVAELIYTLLSELKYELTLGGKGKTNLLIESASKNLNTPLSPNFIAYWLKKAYQLKIKDLNN
ncbi:hypothetical protein ACT3RN_04650 [Psychrobacter sp. AOP5-GZ1-6]|uniref:hypothetical protein n=3 Tax=Psychrobacter TaxID=497 RepID=UPI001787B7FB|nr:hypothetical protein [Psychrobacter sp. FME13]MBE0440552.1 hypothetical protein [Psychrobacter sp. FME13]